MADFRQVYLKLSFDSKKRRRIYRKLMSYLENGVNLQDALRILYMHESDSGDKPTRPTAVIVQDWRRKTGNGLSFGRAVAGWVPDRDRILLEAGEQAGLPEAIKDTILIHDSIGLIKKTIIMSFMYPVVLFIAGLMFMCMFAYRIVPAFASVLPRDKWTGMPSHMAVVADFVTDWLPYALVGLVTAIGAIVYSLPRWVGPLRVKADRIPPWSLYRLSSGASFLLVLSALSKAGTLLPQILRILSRDASPWFGERMGGALRHVSNGANLGDALWATKLEYPDYETVRDLRSYAELEGFEDILREIGEQWINESIEKIKEQTTILRYIALGSFAILLISIASAIYGLQQQVTHAM